MDLSIPSDAQAMSETWLTAALREGGVLPSGRVEKLASVPIAEEICLLGRLWRVTIEYDAAAPPSAPRQLVAKFPTAAAANREVALGYHFYRREFNFYRYLPRDSGLAVPRLYYAAIDRESASFVLLIEDLQAYTLGDQLVGADEAQVFAVGELAARSHARFWGRVSRTPAEWLIDPRAPFHAGLVHSMYRATLPTTLRSFGPRFTPQLRSAAERLVECIPAFWQHMTEAPTTFLHGDLRLDNLAFGGPEQRYPVVMMDFQIAMLGRGPFDVAYFMSQSVPPAVRVRTERALLERYYAALRNHGVDDYTFEACLRDYQRSTLYCLAYPVIVGSTFDPTSERARVFGEVFLARSLSAIEALIDAGVMDDILSELEAH